MSTNTDLVMEFPTVQLMLIIYKYSFFIFSRTSSGFFSKKFAHDQNKLMFCLLIKHK